jgi:hypothetical protein
MLPVLGNIDSCPLGIGSNVTVIGWYLDVSRFNFKCEDFLESRSGIFYTPYAIQEYFVLLRFADIAFFFPPN